MEFKWFVLTLCCCMLIVFSLFIILYDFTLCPGTASLGKSSPRVFFIGGTNVSFGWLYVELRPFKGLQKTDFKNS